MSKRFNIKPPTWPKEYSFQEFVKLNPHIINENQLISLYNQYLNKYLTELGEKKIHFKQSKINQLLTELKKSPLQQTLSIATPGGGSNFQTKYSLQFGGADKENYVTTTFDPDTYSLNQGYTVSYWIKPNEITSQNQLVIGARGSSTRRFIFGLRNATKMIFGGGTNQSDDHPHDMSVDNWYHWVITYTGNGDGYQWVRAYRNGEAVVISNDGTEGGAYTHHNRAWALAEADHNNVPPIYFGARNNDSSTDKFFAFNLTDVAIFNESKDTAPGSYNAVDSDEDGPVPGFVTKAYNNGSPTNLKNESSLVGYWRFEGNTDDTSGNGNHGTLTYTGDEGTDLPVFTTDVPK